MGKTIVSWSPVEGQGATTSHTIALASILSLNVGHRSLLTHTQLAPSAMEEMYRQKKTDDFDDGGIDGLERLVKSKLLKSDDVPAYTNTIYKSHLDFLAGKNSNQQSEGDSQILNTILRAASEQYDFIWIDAEAGVNSLKTRDLLAKADLVLVNLPQNKHIIKQFMEALPTELQDKPYFILLSQYDEKASYTLRNIKRQHHIKVPIFAIPYATGYRDAVNQDMVAEFFVRTMKVEKRDVLYPFVHSLSVVNSEIMKQLGFAKVAEEDWE